MAKIILFIAINITEYIAWSECQLHVLEMKIESKLGSLLVESP